ncbi:MAG: hypothetical protein ACRDX8_09760 [Acidimicrobiales bacterium]
MFISDLRHYLDMPEGVPGPARRMAELLGSIVKAATAGAVGAPWTTALTCGRRPDHRPCPGRMMVRRAGPQGPINWACSDCGDEGIISGWEDSYADLRPRGLTSVSAWARGVAVSDEVIATLRVLTLLDPDCERLVFSARAVDGGAVLVADADALEELVGFVAAEANHESNRRRRQRMEQAFAVLSEALEQGWPGR